MASAILTILYPELFTVYDYRAAEQIKNGSKLVNKTRFDAIWDGYVEFRGKVNEIGKGSTMREKDRYLFGKSRMEIWLMTLSMAFPMRTTKLNKRVELTR